MAKPKISSQSHAIAKADGFKLRMVLGKWYIWLYKNGKRFADVGPFGYAIANTIAGRSGLTDLDRLTAEQEKARG
jgi:hypothetical protein